MTKHLFTLEVDIDPDTINPAGLVESAVYKIHGVDAVRVVEEFANV